MDPLSVSASVLTIIAATIATVKTLNDTVGRYRGRDKTLIRLQSGLDDLINILKSLEEVAGENTPILALLKGPVKRCAQVSREFELAMNDFSSKSKTSLKDWAKLEFMRGDINDFIDTLADYKSTIAIGLGTITMYASTVTQHVVEEYNEMVKDTAYNLQIRLQRIDEKMMSLATYHPSPDDLNVDLQDEKAVTSQCLQICERASSYIQLLQERQPTLQGQTLQQSTRHVAQQFEAQLLTQKTLTENRDNLIETIGRLRERLDSMNLKDGPDRESETLRLREEIEISKQCLEVCKEATNQVSNQKIHIIGEVVADGDCDQVVVTTLADLFNVGVVKAKGRSMQLVASMPADTLRELSKDRYGSRFGSLAAVQSDTIAPPSETANLGSSAVKSDPAKVGRHLSPTEANQGRASSNEVRKRRPEEK